jgi:hypothetical protein
LRDQILAVNFEWIEHLFPRFGRRRIRRPGCANIIVRTSRAQWVKVEEEIAEIAKNWKNHEGTRKN